MRLIPTLSATAILSLTLGLAGCDSADRAALFGTPAATPLAAAIPTTALAPAVARTTLLYPPARLGRPAAFHRLRAARHMTAYAETRVYDQQSVTRRAYGDAVAEPQFRRGAAEDRWDERRAGFAEGYGRESFRGEAAPTAAGRDRDGFLTWPGKVRR